MSFIIKDLSYIHTDKEILFSHIHLSINSGDKIALTGNNGCGKSTLMRILAGDLSPSSGTVLRPEHLYYVPQHFGQYDRQTIAQALGISHKLSALHAILSGDAAEAHFNTLNDDWTVEERAQAALDSWGLGGIPLSRPMEGLSGGEKTRIFLAGMELHNPTAILLDEPTNHLDADGRERLYNLLRRTSATVLVISHDRTLLNLLPAICELSSQGLTYYSGNYDFYKEQKTLQQNALTQQLEEKQKALRLARKVAREVEERKAKQNVRGEKNSIKKGIPRIMMGALKNNAENSSSRLSSIHTEKTEKLQTEMAGIKSLLSQTDKLKTDFNTSHLHTGKILITARNVNFHYPDHTASPAETPHTETAAKSLWASPLTFQLRSGDRLSLKGKNGSGKTTLLKLIMGELHPTDGVMERAGFTSVYLDQEYSLVRNERSVLQQAEAFNHRHLPEHEVKTILNRYLFPRDVWNKPCSKLSGGEKMRLSFCCLMIADNTPDMFILDEPTNNLDIESIEIITATIRDYAGTVIAISHDREFLKDTGIEREILLE
ncbi:ABC transporter ATP-binding protein [Bacteroides sp. AF34-31BH]|uniref:ABC-F family ATP-binding cassette domain-containing protein n=1 Tax=Bacteroides sp. AF34-31BH TaxID=2292931 RepID=UPI000E769901|nr:ABC-F family ATP-binding cassette domain-containing protein [Bacteroides sp. AF34-31BH]RJV03292.1 ABC transporter ATP-binding protein [Bacteroides sp. AF34-31BH]